MSTAEPQSIIHKAINATRFMKRTVSGATLSKKRNSKKNSGRLDRSSKSCASLGRSQDFKSKHNASWNEDSLRSSELTLTSQSSHSASSSSHFSFKENKNPSVAPRPGEYSTIDQNEFFLECMINGKGDCSVVHFFDDSSRSKILDLFMVRMSRIFQHCKFFRMDGAFYQFVSSKLNITSFPTILVIKNKVIADRMDNIADVDGFSETMLREWLVKTLPANGSNRNSRNSSHRGATTRSPNVAQKV